MTPEQIPAFGDWVENTSASDDNPTKRGRFVRVVRIPHGRMNAGIWWELTDGEGEFWKTNPRTAVVSEPAAGAAEAREACANCTGIDRYLRKGVGDVSMAETEDGEIGLWTDPDEDAKSAAIGDTVEEMLSAWLAAESGVRDASADRGSPEPGAEERPARPDGSTRRHPCA